MSIQKITVNGTVTGPNVVSLDSLNYTQLIGDHEYVTDWFTAQPAKMSLIDPAASGGTVNSIASRRIGSSATLSSNPPTNQRPNYSSSDADFNDRGAITHDSGGTGDALYYSENFPVAGEFFKIAVVKFAATPGSTQYLGVSSPTTGNRHLFTASSGGNFSFRCGASGSEASASVAFSTGTTCLIGCWNPSLKRVRISSDFGVTWASGTNASAVVDIDAGCFVGNSSDFKWAEQIIGVKDLSDGSAGALEFLGYTQAYMQKFVMP